MISDHRGLGKRNRGAMAPTDENNRVTMAILAVKLDSLAATVATGQARTDEQLNTALAQLNMLEDVLQEHSVRLTANEGTVNTQCQRIDGRIDRVEDRIKGWQAGQGIFTTIAAVIAGWLGMRT